RTVTNRCHPRWSVRGCLGALLLILLSGRGAAQDRFYMIIFADQHDQPHAEYSHTFATFVRVRPDCAVPNRARLDSHTISWMPKTLNIRVHAWLPETGVALELGPSIHWALCTGQ